MEKKARLMLSQVDSVSEEVLGFALEKIMELGANNVQLIPTFTKKSRPGNILLIDAPEELETSIADYLARELKVSGYHRIETSHVFQKVTFLKKTLTFNVNGIERSFICEVKAVGEKDSLLSIDIDHDFLANVHQVLNDELGRSISLIELRSMIESRLRDSEDSIHFSW
jgi:uncharacterized protein (DUF111 family)